MRHLFVSGVFLARLPLLFGYGLPYGPAYGGFQSRPLGSSFAPIGVDATYDYVIIGGGTSGLTVAERLAENPNNSVAVVEAGGFYETSGDGNKTQIPAYEVLYNTVLPTIDWGQFTTPQPQLKGRSVHYSQGRCWGGSSARNGMVYQRGTTGSYKLWADAVQDPTYELPNFISYFQKGVNFTAPNYAQRGGPVIKYDTSAFSPSGGPLKVAFWNYYLPISQYLRRAFEKTGFAEISGIQSGDLIGFAQWPATQNPDLAIRDSSETSYGRLAIEKTNLQFYQNTLAKRILFQGKTVTGINLESSGLRYTLKARKEVVLAAGAFRSPQLLMVSGIGPASVLQSLDIPVVADLPGVGQDMWDQPGFAVTTPVSIPGGNQLFSNASFLAEAEASYRTNKSGILSVFTANYLAWERLPETHLSTLDPTTRVSLSSYPPDWPDLQYVPADTGPISPNDTRSYVSVAMTLQKTTARGNVTINSTDTAHNPLVNTNWLGTLPDQQLAVQGVRRAREIIAAFGGIVSGEEVAPGKGVQSDEQILEYLRETVVTIHHAAATCKMGKPSDPSAVVDSHGRVLGGIRGLRIVDASVFPLLPPGQLMSTVYALAEKLAADILRGE